MKIAPDTVMAMLQPAAARGISVNDLGNRLLDIIVRDNLFTAILDDERAVKKLAEQRREHLD